MILKLSKIYKKGTGEINEDAYVINESEKIYAVIDGATGLDGVPGYIASNCIQRGLEEHNPSSSLMERISFANKELEMETVTYFHHDISSLKSDNFNEIRKSQRSSSGAACIKIDEDIFSLDYIHAGDCMLFFLYENGDIRTVTYDLIQYLDQAVISEMENIRKKSENQGLTLYEIKEIVKDSLKINREKLNTEKGYGIIDGSKEALSHLEYGKISLKRVQKILLLTDGLLLPVRIGENNAWKKSASLAFENGLHALSEKVENREAEDPECILYPRLKSKDDKTGILIEL